MVSLTRHGPPTTLAHPMTTVPTADSRAAAGVRRGAAVSVRNLTKVYPHSGRNIEVLRDLNFDLHPGEMASVVGATAK